MKRVTSSKNTANCQKDIFPNDQLRLKELFWKYLQYSVKRISEKTILTYKTTFRYSLKYWGDIYLSELTSVKVNDYFQYRLKSSSAFAAKHDYCNLSCTFSWAVSQNYMLINPCKNIKKIKLPEKLPLFFSHDEIFRLLNVIREEDIKDIIIFALNTGLRQMELLTLEWNQIDFCNRYVMLDNQKNLTKARKIRTIPLNDNAFKILGKRKLQPLNDLVFTLAGERIKQDFIVKKFKQYVLDSGINPQLHFHSLRHTFASWLVQNCADINRVSKLLGHSDVKTTEIYAHLRPEDLRNTVYLLDKDI